MASGSLPDGQTLPSTHIWHDSSCPSIPGLNYDSLGTGATNSRQDTCLEQTWVWSPAPQMVPKALSTEPTIRQAPPNVPPINKTNRYQIMMFGSLPPAHNVLVLSLCHSVSHAYFSSLESACGTLSAVPLAWLCCSVSCQWASLNLSPGSPCPHILFYSPATATCMCVKKKAAVSYHLPEHRFEGSESVL